MYDSSFDGNKAATNGGAMMIDGHWNQTSGDQSYEGRSVCAEY